MSNQWTTVNKKQRKNRQKSAYVPKHLRKQNSVDISSKVPIQILSEDAFPELCNSKKCKITKPKVWVENLKKDISNYEIKLEPSNSKRPVLVLDWSRRDDNIIETFPQHVVYEYVENIEDSYIFNDEMEFRELLRRELQEYEKVVINEEDYTTVSCCECLKTDLVDELHQMCPIGFNVNDPNSNYHNLCYLCPNCLLLQYSQFKINPNEYFYRTLCGHIVNIKQHKKLIKTIIENSYENE